MRVMSKKRMELSLSVRALELLPLMACLHLPLLFQNRSLRNGDAQYTLRLPLLKVDLSSHRLRLTPDVACTALKEYDFCVLD
jgi:hypothetical protein